MTSEQASHFDYTITHFAEIARQNRFPENDSIAHDEHRCTICHPELLSLDPFEVYLEVVTQSIKARRPRLDQEFVALINNDLSLMGLEPDVSVESLLNREEEALSKWSQWARDALTTGLELLSIHSPTSREFDLDEAEEEGKGNLIERKVREIMDYQRDNR